MSSWWFIPIMEYLYHHKILCIYQIVVNEMSGLSHILLAHPTSPWPSNGIHVINIQVWYGKLPYWPLKIWISIQKTILPFSMSFRGVTYWVPSYVGHSDRVPTLDLSKSWMVSSNTLWPYLTDTWCSTTNPSIDNASIQLVLSPTYTTFSSEHGLCVSFH